MLKNIGLPELIIILLVLFAIFGSKKLNLFAQQTGEATKELKKIKNEFEGKEEETPLKKKGGVKKNAK